MEGSEAAAASSSAAAAPSSVAAAPGHCPQRAELRRVRRARRQLQTLLDAERQRAENLKLSLARSGAAAATSSAEAAASAVPGHARTGGAGAERLHPELQALVAWIARTIDLSRQVSFHCDSAGGIVVAGRRVLLQRMASWAICGGPFAGMQVSVPFELAPEISALLGAARARGGAFYEHEVANLAERWELICAEMVSAVTGHQEPAIFLLSRDDGTSSAGKAIIVAQWPSINFSRALRPRPFDPKKHFGELCPMPPALAKEEPVVDPPSKVSKGDRVLVELRQGLFRGVVDWVCPVANIANVCVEGSAASGSEATIVQLSCVKLALDDCGHESPRRAKRDERSAR